MNRNEIPRKSSIEEAKKQINRAQNPKTPTRWVLIRDPQKIPEVSNAGRSAKIDVRGSPILYIRVVHFLLEIFLIAEYPCKELHFHISDKSWKFSSMFLYKIWISISKDIKEQLWMGNSDVGDIVMLVTYNWWQFVYGISGWISLLVTSLNAVARHSCKKSEFCWRKWPKPSSTS